MSEPNGRRISEEMKLALGDKICLDPNAIRDWITIKDKLVKREVDRTTIDGLIQERRLELAISKSLDYWISAATTQNDATISNLAIIFRQHGLNNLAEFLRLFHNLERIENELPGIENGLRGLDLEQRPGSISIMDIISENQLTINTPALNKILDAVGSKPIVIFSINGKLREGKSFMLTQFLKFLEFRGRNDWIDQNLEHKFIWQSGTSRVTTGIQVWSKPYVVDVGEREVGVLLMDTQGLFDDETNMQDNARLFAYSILLSSVTMFNVKDLAQDTLQYFDTFLAFAKLATNTLEPEIIDSDESESKDTFQKLILLVRDWTGKGDFGWGFHDDQRCPVNEQNQRRNLKHHFFEDTSGVSAEAKATRQSIKNVFQEITVAAIPYPGEELAEGDNIAPANWRSAFKEHVKSFVEATLSLENIAKNVKRIGDEEMTGETLKMYANIWANIYRDPANLPTLKSILEATADAQAKGKSTLAVDHYKTGIEHLINTNKAGITTNNFESKHRVLLDESLAMFTKTRGLGGKTLQQQYLNQLKETILNLHGSYATQNRNNLEMTQQLVQKETEIRETRTRAINAAQANFADAKRAYDEVLARQQAICGNSAPYFEDKIVMRKQRNRVLGIVVSPSYVPETVRELNHARYQQAIADASAEVVRAETRLAAASKAYEEAQK